MNTNAITMKDLATTSDNDRKAAVNLEIANRSISFLADGQRHTSKEIAAAIGDANLTWYCVPCGVNSQKVGVVMRKLVALGRVKREKVEGNPIEIAVPALEYERYDWKKRQLIQPHPAYTKTIIPIVNYYSLV